jgi:chromate transporter
LWGRIGCLGFGGPPTHIRMLHEECVTRRRWLDEAEFADAVAACNLLPGPASTQLSIYCARRVRGTVGAFVGGVAFIAPGLLVILALAALFLADSPPPWVLGAGQGAGAAVAAVAVQAGAGLIAPSWARRVSGRRWIAYAIAGALAAAALGPWLVLVLVACGGLEVGLRGQRNNRPGMTALLPLAWTAFKVGALSYGGGFVIVPLMQHDAVGTNGWLTNNQFLNAVALGQITPGPVTHTVAVVGYGAAGVGGGLLAALVAFAPSFVFVLAGASRFDRLRANATAQAFLGGAGPAVIGAILGSAIPLARALTEPWQYVVLAYAAVALVLLRRGVVPTLLWCAAAGVVATGLW